MHERRSEPTLALHVVVVTYNSSRDLPGLLADLERDLPAFPGARVCVVDNASSDDTLEVARRFPGVEVVEMNGNFGYAAAINVCLEHAALDAAVLVLNPDLRLAPGALSRLVEAAAVPGVGITVPAMTTADGSVYPSLRNEPSLHRALMDALLGSRMALLPGSWSEMIWDPQTCPDGAAVDWATGAALLISPEGRRRVGRWDSERFFLYSEETDYCRRIRDSGLAVRYVPRSIVSHVGAGSGTSPELSALMTVNRVVYFAKYHSRWSVSLFRAVVVLHCALRVRDRRQRHALRVLLDRGRWGRLPSAAPTATTRVVG